MRSFASILGIVLIFYNLGERSGGASAYSVFNRGANYLLGDLRLGRIDQQLRNAGATKSLVLLVLVGPWKAAVACLVVSSLPTLLNLTCCVHAHGVFSVHFYFSFSSLFVPFG